MIKIIFVSAEQGTENKVAKTAITKSSTDVAKLREKSVGVNSTISSTSSEDYSTGMG
jgi:hypothetical protein